MNKKHNDQKSHSEASKLVRSSLSVPPTVRRLCGKLINQNKCSTSANKNCHSVNV